MRQAMRSWRTCPASVLALALVCVESVLAGCTERRVEREAPPSGETRSAPTAPLAGPPAGPVGTVTGRITIAGPPPAMGDLPRFLADGRAIEPGCATRVKASWVRADESGGLADVVVRLPPGAGVKAVPPAKPHVIDQRNCIFNPHVLAVVEGSRIAFRNSDAATHNVHSLVPEGDWFNEAQLEAGPDLVKVVDALAGQDIRITCDVHQWMEAHVYVSDHANFVVTGPDGKFTLDQVPAGAQKIEAWHPHLGLRTTTVTVAPGATVEARVLPFSAGDYKAP